MAAAAPVGAAQQASARKQKYRQWSASSSSLVSRPPPGFAAVERGVFRSFPPLKASVPFLRRRGVATVAVLSAEAVPPDSRSAVASAGAVLVNLGAAAWTGDAAWRPVNETLLKEAVELALSEAAHPLLLVAPPPGHETAAVVGCLRRLQGWGMSAVLEEYRRFTGSRALPTVERDIECFDLALVSGVPRAPRWFAPEPEGGDRDGGGLDFWRDPERRWRLASPPDGDGGPDAS